MANGQTDTSVDDAVTTYEGYKAAYANAVLLVEQLLDLDEAALLTQTIFVARRLSTVVLDTLDAQAQAALDEAFGAGDGTQLT